MSMPYLTILTVALVLAAASLFLVGVVVPAMLRSMFRYRLWRLRDKVVDEILAGDLPGKMYCHRLVHLVEAFIITSREVTIWRWTVGFRPSKDIVRDVAEENERELGELTEEERARALCHYRQLRKIVVKHLVFGSPSGWMALLCVGVATFLVAMLVGVVELIRRNVSPINFAIKKCWRLLRDQFEDTIATWTVEDGDAAARRLSLCVD
jgi:hypothetical protein